LQRVTEDIALTITPTSFGGRRDWFLCPACRRRAGVLYLPEGERLFACRLCHGLCYRSQQVRRPTSIRS
ncbi:MAG: hypothetical protein WBF17_08210, partial [Phycisphaerae bacterium]